MNCSATTRTITGFGRASELMSLIAAQAGMASAIRTTISAGLDPDDDAGVDDITVRGLHIPVGRPVIARLNSKDVIHSFKIPVMRVTQDVIPGMEIAVWLHAIDTGKFQIGCAQLCGLGHYEMKADLVIESPEDFQKWLDEEHEYLGLDDE